MKRRLITIAGYLLAGLIVIGGTILLVDYGKGYTYDFKTGKFEHRGLLILSSTPSGAFVDVNGKQTKQKTPYRKTYEEGWYDVALSRSGFRTWTKKLKIIPSQANLTQYVILIPQHIEAKALTTLETVTQSLASPDHHKMALVVPAGDKAGIWTYNTQNKQQKKLYSPAATTEAQPAESVEMLEWANDNNHLLIRSKVGDATSLVVVDTNGGDPINITQTFNIAADTLEFNRSNWRQLYWQNENGLQRLDLGNKTVSAVLADHVVSYTFAGDRILYVSNFEASPSLWSLDSGGRKRQLIKNLPASGSYDLAFASYINTPEVAVVARDSHQVVLYTDIYGDKPSRINLPNPATEATFNGDGRFLLHYDDGHVATYDMQENTTHQLPPHDSAATGINWFDNYHLLFNRGDQVVLSEYDGNYGITITRGDGKRPVNAPDNKSVLVTSTTSTGTTQLKSVVIRP